MLHLSLAQACCSSCSWLVDASGSPAALLPAERAALPAPSPNLGMAVRGVSRMEGRVVVTLGRTTRWATGACKATHSKWFVCGMGSSAQVPQYIAKQEICTQCIQASNSLRLPWLAMRYLLRAALPAAQAR